MDTVLSALFVFTIIVGVSLATATAGFYAYDRLGGSWTDARDRSEDRLNSDVSISAVSSDGYDWDVTLQNEGRTPASDYAGFDLVVQYVSASGTVIGWLPYAETLQANSWTVSSIVGDGFEVGVLNTGEALRMEVCLDPPAANGSVNWLQVTTDLGISSASAFTGVPVLGGCSSCVAGDTGWLDASTEAATSGGNGDGFESSPTAAFADGGGFATNADGPGDRHLYEDYGLSISSLCDVAGIEVRLDWWLALTLDTNSMSVELSWDGGTTWTSAKTDAVESTSEHTGVLGGPTDTWGRTWTPQELEDGAFVARVTSNCTGAPTCLVQDFFLDWVPVKVYVTPK